MKMYTRYINPAEITNIMIESERTSKVSPWILKITKSYSPFIDWIKREQPNPIRKLNNCPENIPFTAVSAFPFLANFTIDK